MNKKLDEILISSGLIPADMIEQQRRWGARIDPGLKPSESSDVSEEKARSIAHALERELLRGSQYREADIRPEKTVTITVTLKNKNEITCEAAIDAMGNFIVDYAVFGRAQPVRVQNGAQQYDVTSTSTRFRDTKPTGLVIAVSARTRST